MAPQRCGHHASLGSQTATAASCGRKLGEWTAYVECESLLSAPGERSRETRRLNQAVVGGSLRPLAAGLHVSKTHKFCERVPS